VATVRALKMHGGGPRWWQANPWQPSILTRISIWSARVCPTWRRHIKNALKYGVNVVVAINSFKDDKPPRWSWFRKAALDAGAMEAVVSTHWMDGGEGAVKAGRSRDPGRRKTHPFQIPVPARTLHQGEDRDHQQGDLRRGGCGLLPEAEAKIALYTKAGFRQPGRCAWPRPTCPSPPMPV